MSTPLFRMLGASLGILLALFVLDTGGGLAATVPATSAAENSCVACHQRAETVRAFPPWAQDQFVHWYGAVHGKAGVTCEQCHGGDAAAPGKKQAHRGVHTSREARSPIYYKNVPQTCGKCHAAVLDSFADSHHYQELISDRLAPSCNTCHGFQMDVRAVTPTQLLSRCALCHSQERGTKPAVMGQARAALDAVGEAEAAIQEAQVTLDLAREQGLDTSTAETLLQSARDQFGRTGIQWHSFQLDDFKQDVVRVRAKAEKARALAMHAIVSH